MPALTDLLTKVGLPGTVTSLGSPGKAVGATSINIGSATNWPTSTAVYFAIRRVDPTLISTTNPSGTVAGTYTEWKGVVSGTTIAINATPAYGTDQVYPAGTNTQVYVVISAARENALVDWGLVHADLNGNLLLSAVQNTLGSGGVTSTNLGQNVQAQNIATSAITLGYTQITANPANFTSTTPTQLTGLSQAVTIPAGGRRVEITAYIPYVQAGAGLICGVSIWDGAVGSGTKLNEADNTHQTGDYRSYYVSSIITPSAGSKTYNVGIAVSGNAVTVNAGATYPAYILVKAI